MYMIIRPIQVKDLPAARLTIAAATQSCEVDHAQDPELLQDWQDNACALLDEPETNHAATLVCQMADEIVGVTQFNLDGEIKLFYVAPDWQRRGIGRALLAETALNAQCLGITSLQINSTNTARLFFNQHGFQAKQTDFAEWLVADLTMWKIQYEQTTTH
jgi:putative acetyltransferase